MTRPRLIDVLVTVAVTVPTLLTALRPPLHWSHAVLGLAASLPLLWRRRAIVGVAVVVGCATTGLSLAGPQMPLPYGMLVCAFTFATLPRAWQRATALGVTAAAVVASLLLTGDGLDTYGYVGMAYATAYALGVGTRARQAEVTALRERAKRLDQEHAAARQRERIHIARDLHDVLAHSLTLVAVQAEAGSAVAQDTRARGLFENIAATARDALGQIRRTLGALREGGTTEAGGLDELPDLIDSARQAGLGATLSHTGRDRPVPREVDAAVFRIVQESLTNTLRHSRAETIHVGLAWQEDELLLTIVDDGSSPAAGVGGYGLIGLRERAVACGGSLRAGPEPQGGFAVRARLPLGSS